MQWITRGILFVLVGWLAAPTAAAMVRTVVPADPEVVHTLMFVLIVAALYALLDWGRTADYRIRQTVERLLAERERN